MSSILLGLYHKRLQSLDKTINSLHQTVGNDQALKIMDAPQLLRYKIDRVNELVKQIFNAEKEQIIIYLLNMCENPTQRKAAKEYEYQGKQNIQKLQENEIQMLREEVQMLKRQLIQEKQKSSSYKLQIQQFQTKYNKLELSCTQKQSQVQNKEKQIKAQRILLQEKEQTIQSIRQRNFQLQQEISDLRQQLEKQTTVAKQSKNQVQQIQAKIKQKVQPMRVKVERIESLKKQMGSLFTQLHENKQILFTLKRSIGLIIKKDIQELRKDCEKLKSEFINVFMKTIQNGFQQIKKECEKRNIFQQQKIEKEQQFLLLQMNQIESQMDCFISTKIKNI